MAAHASSRPQVFWCGPLMTQDTPLWQPPDHRLSFRPRVVNIFSARRHWRGTAQAHLCPAPGKISFTSETRKYRGFRCLEKPLGRYTSRAFAGTPKTTPRSIFVQPHGAGDKPCERRTGTSLRTYGGVFILLDVL